MSKSKIVTGNKKQEPKLWVFIPDAHHPYADALAWSLTLKIAASFDPYGIYHLGDLADLERFSKFKKVSGRLPIRAELNSADMAFQDIEAIKTTEKRITIGNHEIRFEDWKSNNTLVYLEDHLYDEEISAIQQAKAGQCFTDFFQLKKRGWKVTDYGDVDVIGQLVISHFLGKGYMSGSKMEKALGRLENHSLVVGHSHHSLKVGYTTFLNKIRCEANTFGWLGSREAALYRTAFDITTEWPLGFGMGYLYPDGKWEIHAVKIDPVNYTCRIMGKEYSLTAEEKKEALEKWSAKSLENHRLSMFRGQVLISKKDRALYASGQ